MDLSSLAGVSLGVKMGTQRVSAGAPWGEKVGYCRALRVGSQVFVSGTVAADESGNVVGKDDSYAQTKFALERIGKALAGVGAKFSHVVRTRIFTTRIADWQEIGRAHGEVFREFPPATSMIEIRGLIGPDFLVEIEAEALIVD
jgi:enamine deaminase RidA (YjgF/YER057c/UK114 family)